MTSPHRLLLSTLTTTTSLISASVAMETESSPTVNDPRLPPELERAIFLLLAHEEAVRRPRLFTKSAFAYPASLCICRRVKAWIEPIIYERILLVNSFRLGQLIDELSHPATQFKAYLKIRPASFFAEHVKIVYLDAHVGLDDTRRILRACTGAVSVGCHHSYSDIADLLVSLPLERLLVKDIGLVVQNPHLGSTGVPWTSALTHLALASILPPLDILSSLPALTHLALGYNTLHPRLSSLSSVLTSILTTHAPRLKCLLIVTSSLSNYHTVENNLYASGFRDPAVPSGSGSDTGSGWGRVRLWVSLPRRRPWSCWGRHGVALEGDSDAQAGVIRKTDAMGNDSSGRADGRERWGDMFAWADREATRFQDGSSGKARVKPF
ncbi:hypothetical protein MKEN_00947700 [Mycena kentingensis (nom. inval.)]|nr:hypothetical protein MKEN_00947700 [Mycena kentingensis (nom. inval.)]